MGDVQFAKQFLSGLDNKATKYPADHAFDPATFPLRIPYTLPKLSNPPHPEPPRKTPPSAAPPGSESASPTLTVTLKSARNPNMTLTIPGVDAAATTIHALKEQVQSHLGGSTVVHMDKIKILLNKKPVPPAKKSIGDALEGTDAQAKGEVEFGVMVMGGAPDPPPQSQSQHESPPPPLDAQLATAPGSEKAAVEADMKKQGGTGAPTAMEGVEPTSAEVDPSPSAGKAEQMVGEKVLETAAFWDDLQGYLEQRLRDQPEAARLRSVFEGAWRSAKPQ